MHGSSIANDQVFFCVLLQRQEVVYKKEKKKKDLGWKNFNFSEEQT
jgi:hypothetical protein